MTLKDRLVVKPGKRVRLKDLDPEETFGFSKEAAAKESAKLTLRLVRLQNVLYAEHKRSVLIVLQAMDAGGKDGAVKNVMSGVNPQGCDVTSFKEPTATELAHDYLWRVHAAAPQKGMIAIFNRSHYEDVLVARVHNLIPKPLWSKRYEQINAFEEMLASEHTTILKFFLHISKDEQRQRFDDRQLDPDKNWKSSEADEKERQHWDEYQKAYEDAIGKCSKSYAPWFIIPANKKWFRNLAISHVIVKTLDDLNLRYPRAASAKPKNAGSK